jgi:hypothetical protein
MRVRHVRHMRHVRHVRVRGLLKALFSAHRVIHGIMENAKILPEFSLLRLTEVIWITSVPSAVWILQDSLH